MPTYYPDGAGYFLLVQGHFYQFAEKLTASVVILRQTFLERFRNYKILQVCT